jgi:hypothetical protein
LDDEGEVSNSNKRGLQVPSDIKKDPPSKWKKIRKIVVSYIFSPYFIMHFCRIALIYWLYRFDNYAAVGLLIWLFYSFLIIKSDTIKYFTFIFAWPCLLFSYNMFMVSNIEDLITIPTDINSKYEWTHFCAEKFSYPTFDFMTVQLTIVIFSVFTRTSTYSVISSKPQHKSKYQNKLKSEGDDLKENLIQISDDNNKNKIDPPKENIQISTESAKEDLSLKDLVVKFIITNIDKITVICMYILAIQKVNISHFSKIIIFLFF